MTDLEITVRGNHETQVAAELAHVRVAARFDGAERGDVVAQAQTLAAAVQAELEHATASNAVQKHHTERLQIWADRPWNDQGEQLPLVHHASVVTSSQWVDFSALSEWISAISTRDGIAVDGISWQLTPATTKATELAVAQGAIAVAVDRAEAYATALGLSTVRAIHIADQGLMGRAEKFGVAMASARSMDASAPVIALEPEEITVSATIEARFIAS